ncbi:hypothetical protein TNCV_3244761 [Trichonephila clavipes]|nr:hypothetical protein TNCV_3244761 [Trichonephila clavipes]
MLGTVNSDSNWQPWRLGFKKWGGASPVGKARENVHSLLKTITRNKTSMNKIELFADLGNKGRRLKYFGGCGSLVVKLADSWLACHELEPSAADDPSCRRG